MSLPRAARRAEIILLSAAGVSDREIAAQVGSSPQTVATWRRRYDAEGLAGLNDRSRVGRPRLVGGASGGSGTPPAGAGSTRDTLLEAASRMIVRRGFASTRVSDIAAEVGVSPAAVHYYFATKEEILVQALLWTNERLIAWLDGPSAPTDDPVERLIRFIERTVPYPGERRDEYLLEIDLWSWLRLHPDMLATYETYSSRWIAHVTEIIQHGIDTGAFTTAPTAADVAERIVAMTDGFAVQSVIGVRRMPPERARELILQFVAEELGLCPSALGLTS